MEPKRYHYRFCVYLSYEKKWTKELHHYFAASGIMVNPITMIFTEEGFQSFRRRLAEDGFCLSDVSRAPFVVFERVK